MQKRAICREMAARLKGRGLQPRDRLPQGALELNVPREITESDWKLLRRSHPLAPERFCERVLAEIERVNNDNARSFHRRYLDIFEIVERRDREMGRIFDDLKRSNALIMLTQMRANGLLMDEECLSLSAETRNAMELLGNL